MSEIIKKVLVENEWVMRLFDMYILGNPNESSDMNFSRIPLVVTAGLSFFVILTHTFYLQSLRNCPNLSPMPSKEREDTLNNVEIFSTRAFVWATLAIVFRTTVTELTGAESKVVRRIVTDSICVIFLLVLIWGDRKVSIFVPMIYLCC